MTIYIVCPTTTATGGTELLHQLSEMLLQYNIDARIYYIGEYENSNVQRRFDHYQKVICTEVEDSEENLIIVPETQIRELFKYREIKKAVWWLSVDFYPGSHKTKSDVLHTVVRYIRDFKVRLYDKKWIHFVQSEYARLYLVNERHINDAHIFPLSDYISSTYFTGIDITNQDRKDVVLYNPKKGFEFTQKIMNICNEVEWIPLINMSPDKMKETMLSAKIYVDFGNHPGKDRIPRETALCGCCVITGQRGSAKNDIDVKIPKEYKFVDSDAELENIKSKILDCIKNYDVKKLDFDSYREKIMGEEQQFSEDVKSYFIEKLVEGKK